VGWHTLRASDDSGKPSTVTSRLQGARKAASDAIREEGSEAFSELFTIGVWMNDLRRLFMAVVIVSNVVACTHSNFTPNVIQLNPHGTATKPANESIESSFTLIATEDGYTGQFTAQTTVGQCWVVQTPITTSGAFTVVPQGLTCGKHDTDTIQVKDFNGHSAVTYIHSV
jgi:hypothetical protein